MSLVFFSQNMKGRGNECVSDANFLIFNSCFGKKTNIGNASSLRKHGTLVSPHSFFLLLGADTARPVHRIGSFEGISVDSRRFFFVAKTPFKRVYHVLFAFPTKSEPPG